MTQTRSFLIIAWFAVAFLLWDAWQRDHRAPPVEPDVISTTLEQDAGTAAIPGAADDSIPAPELAADAHRDMEPVEAPVDTPTGPTISLANDVLRLHLDARGGAIRVAELLDYYETPKAEDQPVELLSLDPERYFILQAGLVGSSDAPNHEDTMQALGGDQVIAADANKVALGFAWQGPDGLTVERRYRLRRGSYLLEIEDRLHNQGAAPWTGNAYQQLVRVALPTPRGGFTNPERLSFVGAAWYSPQDKFEKLKFEKFDPAKPMRRQVSDGWIAMLQHYFVAAIIPPEGETATFSNAILPNGRYLVRDVSAPVAVEAGAQASTTTRVYLGPKLRRDMEAITPGLGLTMDYGIFTVLAQPIHWLLSLFYQLLGNWGWAIILLVVVIKAAMFKLSEAQYRSFAKMRLIQPRLEALKERYGDDRQKYQAAMMELYKKEKINPLGGCLPLFVQFPVFLSLYWVLIEAVELRHAPWVLWIDNLSAPDPLFILPAINLVTMWATQKLSPQPSADPMQRRIMQAMPIVFGVMFAFFPAGLVLYWTTNGLLGLLQQWLILRRHGEPAAASSK